MPNKTHADTQKHWAAFDKCMYTQSYTKYLVNMQHASSVVRQKKKEDKQSLLRLLLYQQAFESRRVFLETSPCLFSLPFFLFWYGSVLDQLYLWDLSRTPGRGHNKKKKKRGRVTGQLAIDQSPSRCSLTHPSALYPPPPPSGLSCADIGKKCWGNSNNNNNHHQ